MKIPFVDLQMMHQPHHDAMMAAIEEVVRKGNFVLGNQVEEFEQAFAAYSETKYAVGVDNGLSALKLALTAYGIGAGDEVIVPANTFIASAAAVTFAGAVPVLVEPEPNTYNIDPNRIEEAITERTRAIMPVHLYGMPARMDAIMEIANRHNLIVIEDASQAHGARYNGQRVGSIGHIAGFSLYPAKNLGAFGDAGIITTNDESVVQKLRALRNCGQVAKYEHVYEPHNHRMDTLHAAILKIKLNALDEWNEQRRQAAQWYAEDLTDALVITPRIIEGAEPVWHVYVIQTDNRDGLQAYLNAHNIATGIHYPIPIHQSQFYQTAPFKAGALPITERESQRILSLPMYPGLTREQVAYIADAVQSFIVQPVSSS
jgi:dTDP-4-amino-4,6-dideoxygalactose transaminase